MYPLGVTVEQRVALVRFACAPTGKPCVGWSRYVAHPAGTRRAAGAGHHHRVSPAPAVAASWPLPATCTAHDALCRWQEIRGSSAASHEQTPILLLEDHCWRYAACATFVRGAQHTVRSRCLSACHLPPSWHNYSILRCQSVGYKLELLRGHSLARDISRLH